MLIVSFWVDNKAVVCMNVPIPVNTSTITELRDLVPCFVRCVVAPVIGPSTGCATTIAMSIVIQRSWR